MQTLSPDSSSRRQDVFALRRQRALEGERDPALCGERAELSEGRRTAVEAGPVDELAAVEERQEDHVRAELRSPAERVAHVLSRLARDRRVRVGDPAVVVPAQHERGDRQRAGEVRQAPALAQVRARDDDLDPGEADAAGELEALGVRPAADHLVHHRDAHYTSGRRSAARPRSDANTPRRV